MKRGLVAALTTASLVAFTTAAAAAPPRRVVVAGPDEDAVAKRMEKELAALGFETVRVGALGGCTRSAVVVAVEDSSAIAATCSDGDQVGIWIADGGTLRLRDVVVVREDGESGRETTAVRAAEVTRATIAMHDAEAESRPSQPPPAPPPKPVVQPQPEGWETFDRGTLAPKPSVRQVRSSRRAPLFLAGAGISTLIGVDANVASFSGQVEVGLGRYVTAAARIELPIERSTVSRPSNINVAPAFAGAGIGVPLVASDSFIIPRLGAGAGVVWLRATRLPPETFLDSASGIAIPADGISDTTASFAMYSNAGLSMRIYRPLRLTVDGILGTTTSRLVVRDQGVHAAYWGTPFGALALRAELMFQ
jgi:hypothetical protein